MCIKPITLYSTAGLSPNPVKISILLQLLNIEYNKVDLEFGNDPKKGVKGEEFLKINPNGRVPAIVDHSNGDFIVWESAAILYYLAEKYDKEAKYWGKTIDEKTEIQTYIAFQISGLGPSQGQVNWFTYFHTKYTPGASEPTPDILARYVNETYRVWGVLEERLKVQEGKGEGGFLVGGRLTIADIAHIGWLKSALKGHKSINYDDHPVLKAYIEKLLEIDAVKAALATYVEYTAS